MAGKYNLVKQLEVHRKAGVTLYCEWEAAADEQTARTYHAKERDEWKPALVALLRKLDPALVARYDILTPFDAPRDFPASFNAWADIPQAFTATAERLARLQKDVVDLARKYKVDLSAVEAPIKRFATSEDAGNAYAEHVVGVRQGTGRPPTVDEDNAWGKRHGLGRDRMRDLRRESPERSIEDKKGGNPNFAKN